MGRPWCGGPAMLYHMYVGTYLPVSLLLCNLVHQIRQHSDLHKNIVIYKERLQDGGLFSIMFSIFYIPISIQTFKSSKYELY